MAQPAARIGDMHVCPMCDGAKPHVGGPVLPPCAATVLTGGIPQARVGDLCTCVGPPDVIVQGSRTVLVMGQPAARLGDSTVHGGRITSGLPTVLIGDYGSAGGGGTLLGTAAPEIVVANSAAAACMQAAARGGSAFVSP